MTSNYCYYIGTAFLYTLPPRPPSARSPHVYTLAHIFIHIYIYKNEYYSLQLWVRVYVYRLRQVEEAIGRCGGKGCDVVYSIIYIIPKYFMYIVYTYTHKYICVYSSLRDHMPRTGPLLGHKNLVPKTLSLPFIFSLSHTYIHLYRSSIRLKCDVAIPSVLWHLTSRPYKIQVNILR